MRIIGISCYYHDSSACLLEDGKVIAAAEEERFTREKHDSSFPTNAVEYCLDEAGICVEDVDYVAFYEKPLEKFDRILETFLYTAPFSFLPVIKTMPVWVRQRLWTRKHIRRETGYEGEILFGGHHESHVASSFYPSPYDEAAFITVDGVGEWNTTTWGTANEEGINIKSSINYPHSLGLLYSAFTYYLGFRVNNGEYKMMGMSSYGSPKYAELIRDKVIDIKEDGSYSLNMDHFSFLRKLTMTDGGLESLFGYPRREPESKLKQHHFDIAASIQKVCEDVLLKMANYVHEETGHEYLCMAGGVALNTVANSKVLEETPFKDVFIQPAAGDNGAAYGVAANVYYQGLGKDREVPKNRRSRMNSAYLGPCYNNDKIRGAVDDVGCTVTEFESDSELITQVAQYLSEGKVVGLYQGRMEFGPRALGNRSILAEPRREAMFDKVNNIKGREDFRPFAPSVLADEAGEYFDILRDSPYMLFVFDVLKEKRKEIPAVTHVDGTSRVQTVRREDNPVYYDIIHRFGEITGTPVVLNTSMNTKGEPIVNTPEDAIGCFVDTRMDYICFPDGNLVVSGDES